VKLIKSPEGKVLFQGEPVHVGHLPVSQETLDLVKKGLREVVAGQHGTARKYAYLPDIEISGKTGTAQLLSRKEDTVQEDEEAEAEEDGEEEEETTTYEDHAWFVAYAPSQHPRIAISVIVEHGEHGSSAAAPIAREIIQAYLGEETEGETVAVVDSEWGEGDGHEHEM
jgi:penicillin-binding protein 2